MEQQQRRHRILVVGNGIAGAVLSITLRQAGVEVWCTNDTPRPSASRLAAGIINPVTGKRYAKSWNFDLFYPFSKRFFTHLEEISGLKLWYEYPLIRLLGSPLEVNEWQLRAARPEFEGLMEISEDACGWAPYLPEGYTYGKLNKAGRVDFGKVIQYHIQTARQEGRIWEMPVSQAGIPDLTARFDRIIFCEGYSAAGNEWFEHIPWQAARGERLLIKPAVPLPADVMVKKQITVVPYPDGMYWCGANYYWDFDEYTPSPNSQKQLETDLAEVFNGQVAFDIHAVEGAIRPVVKDRRPVIGWSHRAEGIIGIFNGMGSKGALMTPWWADHFTRHIIEGQPIDSEVDVQRFPVPHR